MIKYTLVMVAMFLVVATLLAALIVAATNVTDAYADAPCQQGSTDPTTGQPCAPRGGSATWCNVSGQLVSVWHGVGDWTLIMLPLAAVGMLKVRRNHA